MGKTFSTGLLTDGISQDSSNNIGIGGAVNASYKLTVTGTTLTTGAATFSSSVTASGQGTFTTATTVPLIAETTGGNSGLMIKTSATTTNWLLGGQYNVGNGFEITPSTAAGGTTFSTPALVIKNTGNVGIGTSSPGQNLTIAGTASPQFSIVSSTATGSSEIYLGSSTAVYRGAIIYNHSGDYMQFHTNAAERMRITSGGQVIAPYGYQSFKGSISLAASATGTIYTMPQALSADGVYYVYCRLAGGAGIYMASAIVTALANNNETYISNTRTGSNVSLTVSGRDIRITNGGFGTFTWQWSILFQPVD